MAEENDNNNGDSGNPRGNNSSGNSGRQIPQTNPSQRSTIEKGGGKGGENFKK
ncbi:hypothetical protein U1E44_07070 [Arenibacter sp. GZD96]|uniref:hypothetical protein n=1 Tax=Aurantibrevibacter litoralis TaxID=3106030 RepID=UPI002AFFC849|nr:hypothetical protein [Arenibacter sp. GZD-96]MEA1785846.1 hypothetical protein [Arenibacter sp. GZD-96]